MIVLTWKNVIINIINMFPGNFAGLREVYILSVLYISDMIKRNESDVGNIGFEILAKTVFQFLCFILFLALTNYS